MVREFNLKLDPRLEDDTPPVETTLADEEARPIAPSSGSFRTRVDKEVAAPAAAETPGMAPPRDNAAPPSAADVSGDIGDGVYLVEKILDVRRPGVAGRLDVLVQCHGVDPESHERHEPEWIQVSRLTPALRTEARAMEARKYATPTVEAAPTDQPHTRARATCAVTLCCAA